MGMVWFVTQVVRVDRSFKDKGAKMVKFVKPAHVLTFEQTLSILSWSYLSIMFLLGLVISVRLFPVGLIS